MPIVAPKGRQPLSKVAWLMEQGQQRWGATLPPQATGEPPRVIRAVMRLGDPLAEPGLPLRPSTTMVGLILANAAVPGIGARIYPLRPSGDRPVRGPRDTAWKYAWLHKQLPMPSPRRSTVS